MAILRADALLVACVFYLALNIAILDKLLRIGDLPRAVNDTHLQNGANSVHCQVKRNESHNDISSGNAPVLSA